MLLISDCMDDYSRHPRPKCGFFVLQHTHQSSSTLALQYCDTMNCGVFLQSEVDETWL